jgi:aldose 1-epimerase
MDITVSSFGTTLAGKPVERYTLVNDAGASMNVITLGGIITHLVVPDRDGTPGDVVLGFETLRPYELQSPYFGAICGRVANRIGNGTFTLDGVTHRLPVNNGTAHLHGGIQGYDKRIWCAEPFNTAEGPTLRLTLVDPDGAEGYPGTVKATVIYTLTHGNTLKIQFFATTDRATPINLTQHSYFNLKGAGRGDVLDHELQILADRYTPIGAGLVPTGELAPVVGTPFDFNDPTPIGARAQQTGGDTPGYDHNYVLGNTPDVLSRAAVVYEPATGRQLEVWTTAPGMQLYTGNFLDGSIHGKSGAPYRQHGAFCLETQHYPDSVNKPDWPSTIVRPGETYRHLVEYRFGAR